METVASRLGRCIQRVTEGDLSRIIAEDSRDVALDIDSLDVMELVLEMESEFDISIPDDHVERFNGPGMPLEPSVVTAVQHEPVTMRRLLDYLREREIADL
jgi:acyl carrier protein